MHSARSGQATSKTDADQVTAEITTREEREREREMLLDDNSQNPDLREEREMLLDDNCLI